MIIFGIGGTKPQDMGEAVPVTCPNCHNNVLYHYLIARQWFRLYFIPVFPISSRHLLICPTCSRGVKLNRQQAAAAKRMVEATRSWREGSLGESQYRGQVSEFFSRDMGAPASAPEVGQAPAAAALAGAGSSGTAAPLVTVPAVPVRPGTSTPPPPTDPPGATISYRGARFLLGYDAAVFGIWDRTGGFEPVQTWPKTDEGWRQAWTQFSQWEPQASNAGQN